MTPRFFRTPACGRITWAQSLDEALCFGWIDGVRRRIDAHSYCIRFTPRRRLSTWSAVNTARMRALTTQRRVAPAGHEVFAARRRRQSKSARAMRYRTCRPQRVTGRQARVIEVVALRGAAWRAAP